MTVEMSDVDSELNCLLEKLNLSEDAIEKVVVDTHLEKISSNYCREWFRLHSYLDIKTIVAEDIEGQPISPRRKRYQFFTTWKKIKGNGATYRSLIRALLETENALDAHNVGQLLLELLAEQDATGTASDPGTLFSLKQNLTTFTILNESTKAVCAVFGTHCG